MTATTSLGAKVSFSGICWVSGTPVSAMLKGVACRMSFSCMKVLESKQRGDGVRWRVRWPSTDDFHSCCW